MARPKKGITFWDRVHSQTIDNGACLEFTGCKNHDGYGRINKDGKLVFVHREVWKNFFGPIPEQFVVMHTCDNPPCINPAHLAIGPQSANIKDMWAKNRGHRPFGNQRTKGKHINVGETHGAAKFTNADVSAIKKRLSNGEKPLVLANEYNVSRAAIYHIKRGNRWKHVT